MAEKHTYLIFVDSFLNFCKANKNCDYLANFQNVCKLFFYMGPHYLDVKFTFAFDTTLIQLKMTEIRSTGIFAPLPGIISSEVPHG